jgi:membrane-associated phospholipid phosphatase
MTLARLAPLGVAAVVTALVLVAVSLEPYFAGDVNLALVIQSMSPGTGWATAMTGLATAPGKFIVMGAAVGAGYWLKGWPGAVLVIAAIAIEQAGGEASKQIAQRPRPSPELIAVVGRPSGFSFPSTFTTFIAVTFGTVLLLARSSSRPAAGTLVAVSGIVIVLGWGARVALGAHWPSDVVLTTVVCLSWVWAVMRTTGLQGANLPRPAPRG